MVNIGGEAFWRHPIGCAIVTVTWPRSWLPTAHVSRGLRGRLRPLQKSPQIGKRDPYLDNAKKKAVQCSNGNTALRHSPNRKMGPIFRQSQEEGWAQCSNDNTELGHS